MTFSLNLTIGPMFAGKTDDIIRVWRKYKSIGKKVLLVNHQLDKERTNGLSVVKSHDDNYLPCIMLSELLLLNSDKSYLEADVVIIDESQFFPDLFYFISTNTHIDKSFHVYGLSGDRYQNKIGQILDLIPLCDNITHLKSYCILCKDGTLAPFTKEINSKNKKSSILIGDKSKFMSVCKAHLDKN